MLDRRSASVRMNCAEGIGDAWRDGDRRVLPLLWRV